MHTLVQKAAVLACTARVRERLWKKIGRQLAAARLPLEQCFAMQAQRAREDRSLLFHVLHDITLKLNAGWSIGRAIAPYAGPEEVMLIEAGAMSGREALAQGFLQAARLMEKKRLLQGAASKELAYPAVLVLLLAAFLAMISLVLVPRLAVLSNPDTWKGAAKALYSTANFIASWKGAALAGGILCLGTACLASLPRWTGPARMLADRLPPWSVYRLLTGVSWLSATAMLLQQREIKLGQVLDLILSSPSTTPYLRWRLAPLASADRRGLTLGEALCRTKDRWPDAHMADDLRTYSALPGFNAMLAGLADELLQEGLERVQRTASAMGGCAMLFAAACLCLVVAGLFGIQEQVTSAVGSMGGL